MTAKKLRPLALLLAFAMIFGLTACSGNSDANSSNGDDSDLGEPMNTSGAMGRYVETEEPLPEGIAWIVSMAQMPDGSLRMLGDTGGQLTGPWSVLSSTDGGKSWVPVEYPWLADLTGAGISKAALTPDGAYLIHTPVGSATAPLAEEAESEAPDPAADEAEAVGEASAHEAATDNTAAAPVYVFSYGDKNSLTNVLYDLADGNPLGLLVAELYTAENGDLITYNGGNEITQIDTAAWKVKNTYQTASTGLLKPGVAIYGNILAIYSADGLINTYDLETGDPVEEIEANGKTKEYYMGAKSMLVSVAADGAAWFYANDTGVYRVPMDTAVSERLIDGGLSSLAVSNLMFQKVFDVGGEEYLAFAMTPTGEMHLFRYTYNPDIPTEPSQIVSLYSLHDNKTIRSAITGYQLRNPDVRVEYQVGFDGSGGMTAADAMRALSTELLAGRGPDALVLDDMDVDGYSNRGILADISDILTGADTLENITSAFQKDGVTYAIPARFSIPVLLGDGANGIKDLAGLTTWLEGQPTYDIGVRPEELMARFYASCSYRWFGADGKLDKASFRADLEQLGKLSEEINALEAVNTYDNIVIDTLLWYGGATAASYGNIGGFLDVTLFDVAIKNRPSGSYTPFPSDAGGVYIPGTIMGVNAAAANVEGAKDFVKYVLSEDVQDDELGDGFPVNAASLERRSGGPESGMTEGGRAAMTVENAATGELVEADLPVEWPSDEFITTFKAMLRGVSVPVKANAVIREMIIDETSGYLGGNATLDEAVASLAQKMELYLSEHA